MAAVALPDDLTAALDAAGAGPVGALLRAGAVVSADERGLLSSLPLPLLCAVADAVRAATRGPGVRITAAQLPPRGSVAASLSGLSGGDLLRETAITRLTTPATLGVSVPAEPPGLAMVGLCLSAGADAVHDASARGDARDALEAACLRDGRAPRVLDLPSTLPSNPPTEKVRRPGESR